MHLKMNFKNKAATAVNDEIAIKPVENPALLNYSYSKIKAYLKVARPDHWFKNIFMLIGIIISVSHNHISPGMNVFFNSVLALFIVCLMSSVNYIINEIYDAQFDRRHPNKKFRSVAAGIVSVKKLFVAAILLITVSLTVSYFFFNWKFLLTLLMFFVIGGIFYNVPPVRTKDLPFIDVLGESINNPLRLMLGWFAVSNSDELPLMALIGYWSFGAVLVTAKRLAEFRHLGEKLITYRPTFRYYTNASLVSMFFTFISITIISFISLGISYNQRLFILLPLLLIFFLWFSFLAFQKNSIVKEPERILEKKYFAAFCLLSVIFFTIVILNG